MTEFFVRNLGPHRSVKLALKPGLNLLTGHNGSGKTTLIDAVSRAIGDSDAPVSATWGEERGEVSVPGVGAVLRVGAKVTTSGEAVVELVDRGTLADIVDPGVADPVKADGARIAAIMKACPVIVGGEELDLLLGDPRMMPEGEKARIVGMKQTVLAVAKMLRDAGNAQGLADEKSATEKRGELAVLTRQRAEVPSGEVDQAALSVDLVALERAGHDAAGALALVQQGLEQRRTLEALKGTLGERPTPEGLESRIDALGQERSNVTAQVEALDLVIEELEQKLTTAKTARNEARGELARIDRDISQVSDGINDVLLRAERWDASQKALAGLDTLPTEADVAQAQESLQEARQALAAARAARHAAQAVEANVARAAQLDEAIAMATAEADKLEARAKRWRGLAKGVNGRVGAVFARAGIPSLTVCEDGRLYHVEGEQQSLFAERSFGQRVATMLEVAWASNPGGVFPLDPTFLFHLEPAKRRELAKRATAAGLSIVSEWPTSGDEVGCLHLTGEEVDAYIFAGGDSGAPLACEPPADAPKKEAPARKTRPQLVLNIEEG